MTSRVWFALAVALLVVAGCLATMTAIDLTEPGPSECPASFEPREFQFGNRFVFACAK